VTSDPVPDPEDQADDPFTWHEYQQRRRDRPLRELPSLSAKAVRLVRRAAPRELTTEVMLSVVTGVVAAVQLLFTRNLLRALLDVDGGRKASTIVGPLVGFVITYSVGSVVSLVQGELRRVTGELVARHAQSLVAGAASSAQLIDFERPGFHDRLQRAMANAMTRPVQVAYALINLATTLLTAVGVMVALVVVEPLLLPLVLVAFGPVWIVSRSVSRLAFTFELEETEADRRRSYLLWLLTDKQPAKEIRAYGLDGYFRDEQGRLWDERIARLRAVTTRRARIGAMGRVLNGLLFGVVVLVLVWLLSSDRMSVSDAAVAAGAILLLGQRLSSAVTGLGQLYESSLFLSDVNGFLAEADARAQREREGIEAPALESLEVSGVGFRYPSSPRPVLRDVSISVRRGEVVALVGANGSGKTTLAKVLAQLYEPDSGSLRWNDADATSFDLASRRAQVAFVFQDFERYYFTAAENIGFGRPERLADHGSIVDAALRAGAAEFIELLPASYDTLLGPQFIGGSDLSVGQWQRIAVARAFFRDAEFLILDEPSAALDPHAEAALFERLRELCRDRAVIVISHRFSTVKSADRIYVLDDGGVVEHGSHSALIAQGGLYSRMFTLQASQYLDEADVSGQEPA
jgi:ATP-binding cassette subfamily B protein